LPQIAFLPIFAGGVPNPTLRCSFPALPMRNELNVIKSTSNNNNKKDDEGHHHNANNTKQGLTFYLALLKPPSKA
jgi:hypothetical protein